MKKKVLLSLLVVALAGAGFGWISMANDSITCNELGTTTDSNAAVAIIGTMDSAACYLSLREAVAVANASEDPVTITMVANDNVSFAHVDYVNPESHNKIVINKSLTIDGQGKYTVHGDSNFTVGGDPDNKPDHGIFIVGGSEVTIKDLTLEGFADGSDRLSTKVSPIKVESSFTGNFLLSGVTIKDFHRHAIAIKGGNFEINGCKIIGKAYANQTFQQGIEINGNASGKIDWTEISGIRNSSLPDPINSVYYPGFAIVNRSSAGTEITNTTISNSTWGVANLGAGKITLGAGNDFTANLEDDNAGNGVLGIADDTTVIEINSGNYVGLIDSLTEESVSGGTFSADPTDYVAAGKTAVDRGGYYEVVDAYTITFNGNGGATSQAVISGAAGADVSLPTCNATKDGYTCIGWNTGSTAHTGLTSITLIGNTTVYAIFSKSVTGTFYPNGNQLNGVDSEIELGCILYNGESTCEITTPTISNTVTPTVVGYTTTSGSADSASTGSAATINISGGEKYYAQTMKTYEEITVTFTENGNTVSSTSEKCTPATGYNGVLGSGECNITSPDITTADGFIKIGWSTGADDHTSSWDVNTTKSVSGDATYYAQSSKSYSEITVTFDVNNNGGNNTGKTCTPETVYNGAAGGECNIESPDITTADGFIKIGWSTGADDHTSSWDVNTTKSVSGDATYYAQSSKSYSEITVTFDVNNNGGTSGSEVCTPDPTYNGVVVDTCTVTCPSITPASEFTIIGWGITNDSHSADACSAGGTSPAVSSNTTYYAQSSKPEYTVTATYDVGTGVSGYSSISNTCNVQAVYNGASYTACDITLPDITLKDGYGTGIWSTGSEVKNPGDSISLLGDDTYTASATPNDDTQYLVEYYQEDLNGNYVLFETYTGAGTTDTTAIATGDDKSYSGFVFSGTHSDNVTNGNINGSGDLVLKLNYDRLEYELSFVVDGTTVQSGDVKYGADIVAPANPTKDTCNSFAGWSSSVAGLTSTGTMPDSTVTFTANWNYVCSRSSGGGGGGSRTSEAKTETKTETGAVENATGSTETLGEENKDETTNENNEGNTAMTEDAAVAKFGQEQIDAYKWALENGITTMETVEEARLDKPLTRAELAKMMVVYVVKILGKQPVLTGNVDYQDVDANKLGDLAGYIQLAYQYQIMGIDANGKPIEFFNPNGLVTRGEYATVFSRVLFGALFNKEGADFYTNHLEALKAAGILSNTEPTIKEMRGWVMLMMYRSSKNIEAIEKVAAEVEATDEEVAEAEAKAEEEASEETTTEENAEATTGDVTEAPEAEATTGDVVEAPAEATTGDVAETPAEASTGDTVSD